MNSQKFRLFFLLSLAMITWGVSWTNAKILGSYAHPYTLMFWRFLTGAGALIPVLIFLKEKFKCSSYALKYVLLNGLFLTIYNYFYFRGTQLGLAGAGGVLVTTFNPIFTAILTALFFGTRLYKKDYAGLLLGLFGGALIMKIWSVNPADLFASGNIHFILGGFTWAFVTIIASRIKDHIGFLPFSFWSFLFAGFISFPLAVYQNELNIFTNDWIFWLNFLLVSVGSMTFGTTVYFIGARKLGPKKVSAFIFSVPAIAIVTAMLFLGETLTVTTGIGMAMGMTAVYLINK